MLRLSFLEEQGVALAAISDIRDGNCSARAESMADRRAFLECCGVSSGQLVYPKQVHGTRIIQVPPELVGRAALGAQTALGEADGLVTDIPGITLGVSVADCVPVFLFDPVRRAIALLHAGREGTQANIAGAGVRSLEERFGVHPENICAVVGPSAGPCCYEVSEELAAGFRAQGLPVTGRHLDLWGANRLELLEAGVPEKHIEITGHCTICGGGYHSYRAHATAKRNLALLRL